MSVFKDILNKVFRHGRNEIRCNILSVVGCLLFSCCFACVPAQRNVAVSRWGASHVDGV